MSLTMSQTSGPTEPPLRDLTIGGLLREVASDVPDRVALVAGTPDRDNRREWTYAELLIDAERVARAIRAHFQVGERVAVWAPNVPEWMILEFGCAMAGVILVTVNPAFQARELQYVLTQSRSAGLIVLPEFRGNPMLATATDVQPGCPDLREIIRLDEWEAFLADGDDWEGTLEGPENSFREGDPPMALPLRVVAGADGKATVTIGKDSIELVQGKISDWFTLTFQPMPGIKVQGITRLQLLESGEHVSLYLSPINLDSEKPAMPASSVAASPEPRFRIARPPV